VHSEYIDRCPAVEPFPTTKVRVAIHALQEYAGTLLEASMLCKERQTDETVNTGDHSGPLHKSSQFQAPRKGSNLTVLRGSNGHSYTRVGAQEPSTHR
jgi:hypothetical protein